MDMDAYSFMFGEDFNASQDDGPEYRHIWAVVEAEGDSLSRPSRQVLRVARELTDRLGVRLEAVLLGSGIRVCADVAIAMGADVVHLADHPDLVDPLPEQRLAVVAELAAAKRPEILLIPASPAGRELAGALAQRLNTGVVADASRLDLDEGSRQLLATRTSFGGRALAEVGFPSARPQIATVKANAYAEAEADRYRMGEIEEVSVSLAAPRVERLEILPAPTELPVDRARALVVCGQGVGGPEGVALCAQLAEALGAQLAGTRHACEAGWLPKEREVSGRGTTVAPDLYVGVGVSGSMDHQDAMRQARYIVGVNQRENAPLMEMADLGLTGDFKELIPAWIEALKAARAKREAALAR